MNYSIGDLMYDSENLGMVINKDTISISIEWFNDGYVENFYLKEADWRLERWRRKAIDLLNETIPR